MRAGWLRRRELRVLAAGLLGLALLIVAWGARSAERVAGRSGLLQAAVATLGPGQAACQPDVVPPEAERVRVPATVPAGALQARAVVDDRPGAWAPAGEGQLVVPLPAGARAGPARICIESQGPGSAALMGQPTGEEDRLALTGGASAGRMRLDFFYGDGPQPLWGATARALPERLVGATGSGWAPWIAAAGLLAALAALFALLAGRRELLAVVVLGFGSAATWAGVTPLFQASDELAHAAYVQAIAELGHPPRDRANRNDVSQELGCWAATVRLDLSRFHHAERPPWRRAPADTCAGADPRKDAAQYQSLQPPAYYAIAAAGYEAGAALDRPLPDRLLLSRLVSALLAALTVLFAFLAVREAFPASPWPARAGAVAAALQPVMMFNHAAINSDALVFTVSAALAAVLARTWRRGVTLRRSLLIGALLGLGAVAKVTFLLVVPIAVAVQLLVWLRRRELPLRRRLALLAAGWAVGLAPPLAYALLSPSIFESEVQAEAQVAAPTGVDRLQMASHIWQAFLPRLPFMQDAFPNPRPPAFHAILEGSVGRLGWWDDYGIVSPFATLVLAGALALIACAVLVAARRRAWRLPLAVALGVTVAYCVLIVFALYVPGDFQVQPRYMGTLLAVWALAAGACVAALRSQRQAVATAVLAVGMLGWSALALEATFSRWYL